MQDRIYYLHSDPPDSLQKQSTVEFLSQCASPSRSSSPSFIQQWNSDIFITITFLTRDSWWCAKSESNPTTVPSGFDAVMLPRGVELSPYTWQSINTRWVCLCGVRQWFHSEEMVLSLTMHAFSLAPLCISSHQTHRPKRHGIVSPLFWGSAMVA